MTNEEYSDSIQDYVNKINECINDTIPIAKSVIGENILDFDLFYSGIINRSIELGRGLILMLNSRNLTCAGAILRMQIDNCLRTYALSIADDEKAVINGIMSGGSIRQFKDRDGNMMHDGYLKEKLSKYDSSIKTVYDNSSGYIHFSEKGIFQSVYSTDTGFGIQIGCEPLEKCNAILIECAEAFLHYYKLFIHLMKAEAEWKKKYDESQEDNNGDQ